MNKVYCDKCHKKFEIKLKTQVIKDDVKRVYFACPRCKTEYTSYYINDSIKAKQEQIRRLRRAYSGLDRRYSVKGKSFLNKINKLEQEIGREMSTLEKVGALAHGRK